MKKRSSKTFVSNLIVVGNGFDLACGEKTHIFDFVKHALEQPKNSFSPYKVNFIVWLLHRLYFEETGLRWRELLNFNNPELNDWMDFEKVINHLVLDKTVFDVIESIYKNSYERSKHPNNFIEEALANYFENCRDWHGDLYRYCSNYVDFLELSVQEFEEQLQKYLFSIDTDDIEVDINKELLLNKLRDGFRKTVVMDFNYTSLLNDPINHPVYHIHGSIFTKCIVGIDPYYNHQGTNSLYKELGSKNRFTKVYKRLNYSNSQESQQPVLNRTIKQISFFGHSLGEQDYSYFQSVFDYFDLYNSDVVLVFFYMEYEKDPVIKESERLTGRVYKLINRYGETLNNKDHGNNLLNKLLLEGRIAFYQILQEDVFNEDDVKKLAKEYEEKVK